MGDKTKEFVFTLTVEDAGASDEFSWLVNGVEQALPLHNLSTFTLKHGDVVKIMLPVNKDITITENNLDYSVSMKLNDDAATAGNTKIFQIYEASTLAVTNDRNTVVLTGVFDLMNVIPCVIVMVICLLVFMAILLLRTRNRRSEALS